MGIDIIMRVHPLSRVAGEGAGGEGTTLIISYSRDRQYKRIDGRKQLFFDDDVIACVRNVTRTQHRPTKHPANPLLYRDRPWEVVPLFRTPTFNVHYDPQEGLFKCWYEDYYDYFGISKANIQINNRVLYAQSRDGINWEKPPLGKLFMDGHDTNVCFSYPPYLSASCNSVLLDPVDPDPARRYKSVYIHRSPGANVPKRSPMRGRSAAGLSIAFSPNGIDWTPYEGNPIITEWGSDVEILTYDPIDRKYILYGRAEHPWQSAHPAFQGWFAPVWPDQPPGIWGTRRCVYRLESEDCLHWSPPELIFSPGADDNLDDGHYGFTPWRIDELHLGILGILHQVDNVFDVELLHSRDGRTWRRFPSHQSLIPRGEPGSYDHLMVECPTPPLVVGDEIWLYYGGSKVHHDWWIFGQEDKLEVPEAHDINLPAHGHHLCLATLRLDGWVSLRASVREGFVETKPLFSTGEKLIINACCGPGGYVDVEVMDNWDNVWEGFGRADCDRFTGDAVSHVVTWRGCADVNSVPGIVKLRFHLRDADLYSFRIADA